MTTPYTGFKRKGRGESPFIYHVSVLPNIRKLSLVAGGVGVQTNFSSLSFHSPKISEKSREYGRRD
jgi:hypothetical protein